MPGPGEKGADARMFGIWVGQVVTRNDPSRLGRIRWMVPGLVEPASGWAFPLGFTAQKEEGLWGPPAKNENVACGFFGGDPKKPFYLAGPWADGEAPFDDVEKKGLRFYDFHIQFQENDVVLEDTKTGLKLELNRASQQAELNGPAKLKITSLGQIEIDATAVTIMGRVVVPNGNPIK